MAGGLTSVMNKSRDIKRSNVLTSSKSGQDLQRAKKLNERLLPSESESISQTVSTHFYQDDPYDQKEAFKDV